MVLCQTMTAQESSFYFLSDLHTLDHCGRICVDQTGDIHAGQLGAGFKVAVKRLAWPYDFSTDNGNEILTFPYVTFLDTNGTFSGSEQILQIGVFAKSNVVAVASPTGEFFYPLPIIDKVAIDSCQVGNDLYVALDSENYLVKVDSAGNSELFGTGTASIVSVASMHGSIFIGRSNGSIERWDITENTGSSIADLDGAVYALAEGNGLDLQGDVLAISSGKLYSLSLKGSNSVLAEGFATKSDIYKPNDDRILIAEQTGTIWRLRSRYEKGKVGGIVYDDKGVPIADEEVHTSDGDVAYTDEYGNFLFEDVFAGPIRIYVVADENHGGGESDAFVSDNSYSDVPVVTENAVLEPGIMYVRGRFFKHDRRALFLYEKTVTERLRVSVNWDGGEIGSVQISGPGISITPTSMDSEGYIWETDLPVGDLPLGTELSVQAMLNDSPVGEPIIANMTVVPIPNWLDWGLRASIQGESQQLNYKPSNYESALKLLGGDISLGGLSVPLIIPNPTLRSKFTAGIKHLQTANNIANRLSFNSWGTGRFQGLRYPTEPQINEENELKNGIKVGGVTFHAWAEANLILSWDAEDIEWSPGVEARVGANVNLSLPEIPQVRIFWVGYVPVPYYYYGTVKFGISAGLSATNWGDEYPTFSGDLQFAPLLELGVRLGVGVADWLAIEGGLAGGFEAMLANIGDDTEFDEFVVYIAGDIVAVTRWARWTLFTHRYSWDLSRNSSPAPEYAHGAIASREYLLDNVFNVFVPNTRDEGWVELQPGVQEETVVLNPIDRLLPDSDMDSAGFIATCWLEDNGSENALDYSQVVWSICDPAGIWSMPEPVLADGTWDDKPSIAMNEQGEICIAWENADSQTTPPAQFTDDDLFDLLAEQIVKTDISIATVGGLENEYDTISIAGGDIAPNISLHGDEGLVTFLHLDDGDFMRNTNEPIAILSSFRNGDGGWESPTLVAEAIGVKKHTSAIWDSGAVSIWTRDTDGNPATMEDIEIEYSLYTKGIWSAPVTLTNNNVIDDSPTVALRTNGNVDAIWFSNGDIVTQTLNIPRAGIAIVAANVGQSGELAVATNDQRTVVSYQSGGSEYSDMWIVTQLTDGPWSEPMQMTSDRTRRNEVSLHLASDSSLHAIMHAQDTETESRVVAFDTFEREIAVPVASTNSLRRIHRPVFQDMSIDHPLFMTPEQPGLCADVTLSTVLRNNGDSKSTYNAVEFFHGDPDGGSGYLLGTVEVTQSIPPGDGIIVSYETKTEETNDKVDDYYARIISDGDDANNLSYTSGIVASDVAVGIVRSQAIGEYDRRITARIENGGSTDIGSVIEVHFYEGVGSEGQLVHSDSITTGINGNRYFDIGWTAVNVAPFPNGSTAVTVVVDPNNLLPDQDTSNNIGVVTLFNLPHQNTATHCPEDFDGNGQVAVADLSQLIAAWGSSETQFDLNSDGVVGVHDLLQLVAAWGACPD
ncbi:MAG: hypothetical protein ACI9JK_000437 [Phycisphaerales bacterium]|jgi:hypothetical protein